MTKYTPIDRASIEELALLSKALSDEGRIRILVALGEAELCVCQLTELLELAPSTVSKHLSVLRQARLVQTRKKGRWVYARRSSFAGGSPQESLVAWVDRWVDGAEPTLRADGCRLESILERFPSPEEG